MNNTDIKIVDVGLYFIPIKTRMPLMFGKETLTTVTCARVFIEVEKFSGIHAKGWGETPLNVQWVWPNVISYKKRLDVLKSFTIELAKKWREFNSKGHPIELGYDFIETYLKTFLVKFNSNYRESEKLPFLAALACCSPFDIACHDAYGNVNNVSIYQTYNSDFMNHDLSYFIESASDVNISFKDKYPEDFLKKKPNLKLVAWHLVGGEDPITIEELTGNEPNDEYPVLLTNWIKRDGLKCLKIKLTGKDKNWDTRRIIRIGQIAYKNGIDWLSTDFNCTVTEPEYVISILKKLLREHPKIFEMLLYIEQPFPCDLEQNLMDVRSVSSLKLLLMDESAHDWRLVRLGRRLGWTGIALKTCKTQTGALLALSWAKAHEMSLMVQDLTNPMLAQIPHVLLAAYAGTIMGVETNSMQFYPDASKPEQNIHPYLYRRINGFINLSTIKGPGFGYRLKEIKRELPLRVV